MEIYEIKDDKEDVIAFKFDKKTVKIKLQLRKLSRIKAEIHDV